MENYDNTCASSRAVYHKSQLLSTHTTSSDQKKRVTSTMNKCSVYTENYGKLHNALSQYERIKKTVRENMNTEKGVHNWRPFEKIAWWTHC